MNEVIAIAAPVFFIIALGYVGAKRRVFGAEVQRSFSLYVFYFSMPCYLFLNMANSRQTPMMSFDYIAAFASAMVVVAVAAGLYLNRVARRDFAFTVLGMMSASYTNSAFIGIPIIVMAYGSIAPVVVVTLFQIICATTAILASLEIYQQRCCLSWRQLGEIPKAVLLNPIIGGSLLGITFAMNGWAVPVPVERICQLLGSAGVPTALFALGLSLGGEQRVATSTTRQLVYVLVVLKIVLHPALAWLFGHYAFGLSGASLGALTIIAGMPTAMNNFTFAQRYGAFVRESSQVVFLSTVLWLATLPVLLFIFKVGT
ncbi:MAG: AEC family transporter [Hyphomicrobiaceae bacterium]